MMDRQKPGELVARAAEGDGLAFAMLVDPVSVRLLVLIRRIGGRALSADFGEEDLFQTVLERAWRLLPTFEYRGPESFYRWLVALARAATADRVRYLGAKGRGKARQWATTSGGAGFSAIALDTRTSVSRLAQRREEYDRADQVLRDLDPPQREVVEAHLLEARSLGEIASQLGITKNAVWERLHRGLSRIKREMEVTP